MGLRAIGSAALLLIASLAGSARAQAPGEGQLTGTEEAAAEAGEAPAARPPVPWRWQQVLSAPRIGGRLRSVTVDPHNPNRIFVGTGEGTILRSTDGGITWREIELSPFVLQRRTTRPLPPGLPRLGERPAENLTLFYDPPLRPDPTDRRVTSLPLNTLWFSIRPEFISLWFVPTKPAAGDVLLRDTTRSHPTLSVRRIALCPGAEYPLLVGTRHEVLGSTDDGLTFVRLLRVPGSIQVRWVTCDDSDPRDIMVATDFGMFRSRDGGVSFDQDLSGWPGRPATAVAYGRRLEGGGKRLYVATGDVMFVGDPDSEEGMVMRYPDFDNIETAPWTDIQWIEATDESVWLGTLEGVRASSDGGQSWANVAPNLFGRHVVPQVHVGTNETGGRRIAVLVKDCPLRYRCRRSLVYASDDDGRSWHPFFDGATRRTIEQLAAAPAAPGVPPRWWVVTGGELWATVPPGLVRTPRVDREAAGWARQKLRRTPPMGVVIDEILGRLELDVDDIDRATGDISARNYAPLVHFELSMAPEDRDLFARRRVTSVVDIDGTSRRTEYAAWVYATWVLPDTAIVREELSPTRNQLYELRRQVAFIAEDALHERRMHLSRLARGMSDPLQVEILKERIAALEAVVETWMGSPIEGTER